MNKAWCTAVALAGLVSVFGCGDDDGTTTPAQTTGGSSGGAASGGTRSSAAGTAAMAPAPVECGSAMCSAPMLPGGMGIPGGIALSMPCCADEAKGTCGSMSGTTCMPPPAPAPNCPAPPSFGGFTLTACCVEATQICGIDASMAGMGCVDLGGLGGAIPGLGGGGMTQTKCDGTPVAPPVAGAPAPTAGVGGTTGGSGGSAGASAGAGGVSGASGASAGAGGASAGTGGAAAGAGGSAAGVGGSAAGAGGT